MSLYFKVLLFSFIIPFIFSFHHKIKFYKFFKQIAASLSLIGLFFIIPLIYFYLSKKIKKEYLSICFFIFTLILFHGVVGWYMVKSGLINNVSVSHYRLSLHLTTALIIASSIFWLIKNVLEKKNKIFFNIISEYIPFLRVTDLARQRAVSILHG